MSSILKALKRLENENAARKPDSFKIDAEILKSGSSRRLSSVTVMVAACAVFACGGLAAYLILKRDRPSASVAVPPPLPRPEARTEGPAVNVNTPEQPAVPAAGQIMVQQKSTPAAAHNSTPALQPAAARPQSQFEKPADSPQQAVPAGEPRPVTPLPATAPVPVAKPATLKVDGIAFQDGGTDSLAVVNGTTVTKGSQIEGARVEEILRDRVRFSRGGEKFEIVLDKSN